MKTYQFIYLETKKIIKNPFVVFFEDKAHLEDCPSGKVDKNTSGQSGRISKSDMEDLDMSDKVLDQDKEPDMKDKLKADVLAMKSTHNGEATKLHDGEKTAT